MRRMITTALLLAALGGTAHAADGDPAKGETAFRQCAVCHSVGPGAKAKVGPPLNGTIGNTWAHVEGFAYSQDLQAGKAAGKKWDDATFLDYIENPKRLAPKGKMAFAGVRDPQTRADILAYVAQFDAQGNKK